MPTMTPLQKLLAAIGKEDCKNWSFHPQGTAYAWPHSRPDLVVNFDPTSPAYEQPWCVKGTARKLEWHPTAEAAVEVIRALLQKK